MIGAIGKPAKIRLNLGNLAVTFLVLVVGETFLLEVFLAFPGDRYDPACQFQLHGLVGMVQSGRPFPGNLDLQ